MNRIKQLRKEKGWNQNRLAKELCTTQANISGWESEKWQPDINSLKVMSKIFDVSIDYILDNQTNSEVQQITPNIAKNIWLNSLKEFQRQLIEYVLKLNELNQYKTMVYMYALNETN